MPQQASARLELKPAQQRALAMLRDGETRELTRGAYQELTGVSRSQAAYDLAELVESGLLERVGSGRTTRYLLAAEPNPTRRHWTSARIRAELTAFCDGRTAWPSPREFKAAGHADLYVAASRYGGVGFWARELGLSRDGAPSRSTRAAAHLRWRLSWATAAAVSGAVAVVAAVAAVQGLPGDAKRPATTRSAAAASERASAANRSASSKKSATPTTRSSKPKHTATRPEVRTRVIFKRVPAQKVVVPQTAPRSTPVTSAPASYVSSPAASPPPASPPPASPPPPPPPPPATSVSSSSSGPTPLRAPSGQSSGPTPLAAPRR